ARGTQAAGEYRLGPRGRMMLGLELQDARARAVAVDDAGQVVARAVVEASDDLGSAAQSALQQVGPAGHSPLGVAAAVPDAASVARVLQTLSQHHPGPYTQNGATPAGIAAAVAEAWIGAARDVQDVVYFAVGEHTSGGVIHAGSPATGTRGRAASVA